MKIAQVTAVFPPYRSGIGQVAYQYAKGLNASNEKVEVFTVDFGLKQNFAFNCHYLQAWPRWGKAGFCPQLLWQLDKFDVVQLHYPAFGLAEITCLWRFLNKNKKLFLFYHHDLVGQGKLGKFFWLYQKLVLPIILRLADVILVSSFDYIEHSLIKKYYQQNKEKFVALPFGADEIFIPSAEKIINKKNILFVGGLDKNHYFKGVDNLILACSRLTAKDWRLFIVGSGELAENYKNLARELKIQDNIVFTGTQTDDELVKLFQQAYVFCLPSIDKTEAFGIVLLEAMACGTPVIASNLPGVRSVVTDNQTGFLVKPNDVTDLTEKLELILLAEDKQKNLSQNAQNNVRDFYRWPKIIKNLRDIYYV
jgi:glycosyltransferase involved in cell wall biosynthesis